MLEYTTFQRLKGLVSYSKFPFEKMDFLTKPTVLAAIHSPFFPSVCITASAAYARKIATHLRWRRQRQLSPCRIVDHLDGWAAAQHTPLIS